MWPHERSLVQKLEKQPFALIGVNTNQSDTKKLKEIVVKEDLPWRSFAGQKIVSSWNSPGTPAYYVLDSAGVIRFKWVGNPGAKAIDDAVHHLLPRAKTTVKPKSK
jgi:hypothetical protein